MGNPVHTKGTTVKKDTFSPFSYTHELTNEALTELECLVDRVGLLAVVSSLGCIAGWKADHIREHYQDTPLAKRWDKASNVLSKVGYTRGLTA